ncbi:MAG: Nre family DNA repair protein [Candidatus Helarchaeota archaeon]
MVRPPTQAGLCVRCKGSRMLCGKSQCPIILKQQALIPLKRISLDKNLEGASPPSFFVGHNSYPKILVGPMIQPIIGEVPSIQIIDEPETGWIDKNIEELVKFRSSLLRTSFRVKDVQISKISNNKLLEISQELIQSSKKVDTEVQLDKDPSFKILYDVHSAPLGPSGKLKKIKVNENPKIERPVEKTVSDTDFKATDAMNYLYNENLTVTQVTRILSAGLLGLEKNRRLVPTRWAITATDDTVSKKIIEKIKDFQQISEYHLFNARYLDNHFQILLIPKEWSFENLETWNPKSSFNPSSKPVIMDDFEFYKGRVTYAKNVTGAYYAARLGVVEYLQKIRKQATCIVFREVSSGYIVPLGVWVIRETVRKAFKNQSKKFSDLDSALIEIGKSFQVPLKYWVKNSKLLERLKYQRTLFYYIQKKEQKPVKSSFY